MNWQMTKAPVFFVLEYDETSESWTYTEYNPLEELGWDEFCRPSRIDLAVTDLDPDNVFLSIAKQNINPDIPNPCEDPTFSGQLIVFDNVTKEFEMRGVTMATWNMADISISPLLVNGEVEIFIGSVQIRRSTDSGWNFLAETNGQNTLHADTRGLHAALVSEQERIILSAHDGGVSIFHEINGSDTWQNKTGQGLNIGQFYGIGTSTDRLRYLGGCQDESVKVWDGLSWNRQLGGDGGDCLVDLYDPGIQYAQTWTFGTRNLHRFANGVWNAYYGNLPHQPAIASAVRPMEIDQGRNLYIGHVQLNRREHNGTDWVEIGDLDDASPRIRAIGIAPSNENVIIVGRGDGFTASQDIDNLVVTRNAGLGVNAQWAKIDDFAELYGGVKAEGAQLLILLLIRRMRIAFG